MAAFLNAPVPRLVITVEGGTITGIYCDGVDLTNVAAFVVDYDTEGADHDDGVRDVGGEDAFFSPHDIEQADDDLSSAVRNAYAAWALEDDDDLEAAADGEDCTACHRPSIDCSRAPCAAVIADRGED
jgi:hypothetical protein